MRRYTFLNEASNVSGKKLVAKNTAFLAIVQLSIYFAPLVILPYLTRTLTPQDYGVYAAGFSMFAMLSTIGDYGFSSYGPYMVASRPGQTRVLNRVLSTVVWATAVISIPLSMLAPILAFTNSAWRSQLLFFALIGASVLVNCLLPIWFFQGIQRAQAIVLGTIVSRGLFVLSILIFVRGAEDLWKAAAGNLLSLLITLILYYVLLRKYGFTIGSTRPSTIFRTLKAATPFFISKSAVVAYTSAFPVVIGAASGSKQVAIYSIADQLYRAARSIGQPIMRALFPHAVKEKSVRGPITVACFLAILGIFALLVFWIFGYELLVFFVGPGYEQSYGVLLVLLIALVFSGPAQLLGFPAFGAIGKMKYANYSVYAGGILAVLLVVLSFFIGSFTALYAAYSVLAIEFTVVSLRIYWLWSCLRETRR